MKYILIFSFALVIWGCEEPKKEKAIPKKKIELYLESQELKNKGYDKNNVIKEEMNAMIFVEFPSKIDSGYLSDLPLKLMKVERCRDKFVANYKLEYVEWHHCYGLLNKVDLELFAFIDEATARNLIEGKYYLSDFKFIEYINYKNNRKYCVSILDSPFIGYFMDEIEFGAIGVNLISTNQIVSKIGRRK